MTDTPLISCIMPTANRRQFVPQAIRLFLAQDWPHKELIVVDDGDDKVHDLIPASASIRYVAISEPCTIGMKRNIACSLARGEIMCHSDDDDYYGPHRLSRQVQPFLEGQHEVSAYKMGLLLRTHDSTLWRCSDAQHAALFAQNVRSGTLMYPASYWRDGLCYASISAGEDVRFLHGLLARGARLARLVDDESYICVRHGHNSTAEIEPLAPPGWERVAMEAYLSGDDRAFYAGLAGVRA